MLLAQVADTSAQVAAVSSRLAKLELLAACLRACDPAEVPVVAAWLSGELTQRRTGVGWAALQALPPPSPAAVLGVREVDARLTALAAVAGKGSAAERRRLVHDLFGRATAPEQRLLAGLVGGELRQGAQAGLLADAVARAAGVSPAAVRSALTLAGSLPEVAAAALAQQGRPGEGLDRFRLQVGRPLSPMLASPGSDLAGALARTAPAVVECKLDGVRVQVHRDGEDVRVFTRTLDDITARVPELVALARSLPAHRVVLDGEALALRPDGRPQPFQVTASRAASAGGSALSPAFFDVLHADGEDLIGLPLRDRAEVLEAVVPPAARAERLVTGDLAAAQQFTDRQLAAGHEGVVVKALDAPYEAGRRGGAWLKVKPVHTLDLLVLAAEWGHGRRRGWLSNLHLGARDPAGGPPVMLGKTFKGLTDALLAWQTERLLSLAVERPPWGVVVRPELVVEIALDGVQTSPRYPGGVALRFARVLRYREDKPAAEADVLTAVRALLP